MAAASASKNESRPPRHRILKILGYFAIFFAIFIIIPFAIYFFSGAYKQTVYKHPYVGFTIFYPKSLKMETPTLPPEAKCKIATPCYLLFKNSSFSDSVINWIFVISTTDLGVKKDDFIGEAEKGLGVDVSKGEATITTINNRKVYKYVNDPAKPSQSLTAFYKMLKFDPSLEQSVYMFISGDSVVLIGFRKPPSGASSDYNDYLNIKKLFIPN